MVEPVGIRGLGQHQGQGPQAIVLGMILVQFVGAGENRQEVDDIMRGVRVDFYSLSGDDIVDGIVKILLQVTNPDYLVPRPAIDHKHPPQLHR